MSRKKLPRHVVVFTMGQGKKVNYVQHLTEEPSVKVLETEDDKLLDVYRIEKRTHAMDVFWMNK